MSEGMSSLVRQTNLWRQGVSAGEVRAALRQLFLTGDAASLAEVLRDKECVSEDFVTAPADTEEVNTVHTDEGIKVDDTGETDNTTADADASEHKIESVENEDKIGVTQDKINTSPMQISGSKLWGKNIAQANKCDLCDYVPSKPSNSTIKVHKDAVHFGVTFNCNQCSKVFTTHCNLLKHITEKHNGQKLNCSNCNFNTDSKEKLKYHNEQKHTTVMIKCHVDSCEYSSPNARLMSFHILARHEDKKFHCLMCNKKFHIIAQLKIHIKLRHGGLFCDICFFQPLCIDEFWDHTEQKHGGPGSVYTCSECGFVCPGKLNLKSHIYNHKSDEIKTKRIKSKLSNDANKCDICQYRPKQPSRYVIKQHKEAVHLGIRYPCPYCKDTCTTRSNLLKHVSSKHEGKQIKCIKCSYTTVSQDNLKYHNEKEHLGILYFCEIQSCNYSASCKSTIKAHLKAKHSQNM